MLKVVKDQCGVKNNLLIENINISSLSSTNVCSICSRLAKPVSTHTKIKTKIEYLNHLLQAKLCTGINNMTWIFNISRTSLLLAGCIADITLVALSLWVFFHQQFPSFPHSLQLWRWTLRFDFVSLWFLHQTFCYLKWLLLVFLTPSLDEADFID